jgi:hypothetical protein
MADVQSAAIRNLLKVFIFTPVELVVVIAILLGDGLYLRQLWGAVRRLIEPLDQAERRRQATIPTQTLQKCYIESRLKSRLPGPFSTTDAKMTRPFPAVAVTAARISR